jgi:hypothetical protein
LSEILSFNRRSVATAAPIVLKFIDSADVIIAGLLDDFGTAVVPRATIYILDWLPMTVGRTRPKQAMFTGAVLMAKNVLRLALNVNSLVCERRQSCRALSS